MPRQGALPQTDKRLGFDVGRLCDAMQRARLALRRPREERVNAVRQFVGHHWSEEGSQQLVPCNLISLYVDVVGRKLVANNPRVMLSTDNRRLKPIVNAMESWANKEVVKTQLDVTLRRVVLDALFSIGICKVALATPADAAALNWSLKAGQPFAARVDLDDFVFDHHARDFSECGFMGHRYRVPLRTVRESKMYAKSRENLTASEDRLFNFEGDERLSVLGRTTYGDMIEFEDMVDLWEVYLPRHKLVVTLRDDSLTGAGEEVSNPLYGKALRVQRWLGPDSGPYHILALGVVPGNAMPKAPIQDLIDLHEAVNRIIRKLVRQSDRQKEVTFVSGGATEDGERAMNANDGEAIKVDNPDKLKTTTWGGPNDQNFRLFVALKDLFDFLAGGLSLMGGLGPQSKTLGQDELLNQNASASISSMQDKCLKHTADVLEALCWYWHHDPNRVMRTKYHVPGMPEISVDRQVFPAGQGGRDQQGRQRMARDHRFEEMDIKVDPYSLQHQTPAERIAALNQIVGQIITPLAPVLQQQGIALDMHAYLQKLAKFMNLPDLPDIVTYQPAPQQSDAAQGQPATPQGPAQTTRNYTRRSVGGNTPQAREAASLNSAAGGVNAQRNGQPQGAGVG